MPEPTGWPFLVAAGRHRDYSTLLAPDFLVADLDFGILDEVARPDSAGDGRATVVGVRTRAGRHLTVAYATRTVTEADVEPPICDEYGRPLRLIYGFVSRRAVADPAAEDLRTAYAAAIAVYRRFLRDEDAVTVVSGQSYPLHSRVDAPSSAPPAGGFRLRRSVTLAVGAVAAAVTAAVIIAAGATHPNPTPCPTVTVPSASTRPSPAASPCPPPR